MHTSSQKWIAGFLVATSAAVAAPAASAAPLSPAGTPYLTGSQVADLYQKYTFCYPSDNGRCSATEELNVLTPDVIRITHSSMWARTKRINSFGDFAAEVITGQTALNPDAVQDIGQQTLEVRNYAVCRNKMQRFEDAQAYTARYINDANVPNGGTSPISSSLLATFRQIEIESAGKSIANEACSAYFLDRNGDLRETVILDGMAQPSLPSLIKLLPRGQLQNLTPQ